MWFFVGVVVATVASRIGEFLANRRVIKMAEKRGVRHVPGEPIALLMARLTLAEHRNDALHSDRLT